MPCCFDVLGVEGLGSWESWDSERLGCALTCHDASWTHQKHHRPHTNLESIGKKTWACHLQQATDFASTIGPKQALFLVVCFSEFLGPWCRNIMAEQPGLKGLCHESTNGCILILVFQERAASVDSITSIPGC